MKENNFIFGDDGYSVISVKNEPIIKRDIFKLGYKEIEVIITENPKDSYGELYYNVYVLDDEYKRTSLNCLKEQIPREEDRNYDFKPYDLEIHAIEHYLWAKYGNPSKDEVLSFGVVVDS